MGKAVEKLTEVQVHGKRFMVDMTGAKVVDEFRIGDPIKVLIKRYNDEFDAFHGMIIGFDNFENLPTVVIAYFEHKYGDDAELKVVHMNSQSKGIEITHTIAAELKLDPQAVLDKMNSKIAEHRTKIREIENKKRFFLTNFSKVFGIDTSDLQGQEDDRETEYHRLADKEG